MTATPLDFPSVRAGIAAVLNTIPEIVKVNPYDPGTVEAANNMPFATLRRGLISTTPVSVYGEPGGVEGLGQESHEVEWVIRVYAQMSGVIDAQEKDDLFASRLVAAFDANRIIDPNGPGATRLSRLGRIEPFEEVEGTRSVWVTIAYLTTILDSSIA